MFNSFIPDPPTLTLHQKMLLNVKVLDMSIRKSIYTLFLILVLMLVVCSLSFSQQDIATVYMQTAASLMLCAALLYLWRYQLQKKEGYAVQKHIYLFLTTTLFAAAFITSRIFWKTDSALFEAIFLASNRGFVIILHLLVQFITLAIIPESFIYFLWFLSLSLLPLFVNSFSFSVFNHSYAFFAYTVAFYICIAVSGWVIARLRRRSFALGIQNKEYVLEKNDQIKAQQSVNQLLKDTMAKRAQTEHKLIKLTNELEHQVNARTLELQTSNESLLISKQNLEFANKIAGIGSWEWDLKNNKFILTTTSDVVGYSSEEMSAYIGKLHEVVHPDDIEHMSKAMILHFKGKLPTYDVTCRIKKVNSEGWIWIHGLGQAVDRDTKTNRVTRMLGIYRNITVEKEIAEREKLSATVFDQATQGFFIMNKDFLVLSINKYLSDIVGFSKEKPFTPQQLFNYTNLSKKVKTEYLKIVRSLVTYNEFEGESILKDSQGLIKPVWLHINCVNDEITGLTTHYVGIVSDLTQRKVAEQRLDYLANYDSLTDLPNRNLFMNRLHDLVSRATNSNQTFALLRVNIDRFRTLNDSLGADNADTLLKKFAGRLLSFDSEAHLIARSSGADFIIVLMTLQNDNKHIHAYAQKLVAAFDHPFLIDHQEVVASISVGIALFPDHGRQVDVLLNHADSALTEAKELGGRAIHIYQHNSSAPSIDRLLLEQEFRKALINDELAVYFQPKANLSDNKIIGFEALVRWIHPKKGIILPDAFVHVAEENGLISKLGEIVLEKTCKQLKAWEKAGFNGLVVSVNTVVQQIKRGNLLDTIDRILAENNVSPSSLELEITENYLMDDTENVNNFLADIKKRGIEISLDDFGTGYSCLSYLGKFSINTIKIDRSFISPIGSGATSHQEAIVTAILALGRALNLRVVAEGVETEAHLAFLRKVGCDAIQGYLINRPLPALEATKFLEKSRTPSGDIIWQA